MWRNDSDKVDWTGLFVSAAIVVWLMLVMASVWESCTLF